MVLPYDSEDWHRDLNCMKRVEDFQANEWLSQRIGGERQRSQPEYLTTQPPPDGAVHAHAVRGIKPSANYGLRLHC